MLNINISNLSIFYNTSYLSSCKLKGNKEDFIMITEIVTMKTIEDISREEFLGHRRWT